MSGVGLVFGPVPSRRLGRSLGVNNIPPKSCTYSCVYCQLGRTLNLINARKSFYDPKSIVEAVYEKLKDVEVDYVTFVPDGEPTLDLNLGSEISRIKELGVKVAVLTNASLLWREDVRNDLAEAHLVSIKVDAINARTWKVVNRPHASLKLSEVLEGVKAFARGFKGTLYSETMLVEDTGQMEEIEDIALFIRGLNVSKAYIAIPTRPPAEEWVKPPSEQQLLKAYKVFIKEFGEGRVGLLTGFAEGEFGTARNPREELLSIMSVHPMRRSEVERYLERSGVTPQLLEELLKSGVQPT